jgi:hypothetical protein
MLQCLYLHVASAYSRCFICFHTYVASVLSGYWICFHTYVARVSSGCCICLQWLSSVFRCFASVSDVCYKCFSCFGHMLQVFHLDVAKVDLVLHMLQWDPYVAVAGAPLSQRRWSPRTGMRHGQVSHPCGWRARTPCGCANRGAARETECGNPYIRALAMPTHQSLG